MSNLDLSTLNINQKEAVEWQDGAMLVLAGPGSGKTRVLTYRIAKMLQESYNEKYKILGLTFTKKAATEMRERVQSLVPDKSDRALLTTFHSFCSDILRQHGAHIGLKPNFTILKDDPDREIIYKDALKKANNYDYSDEDIKYFKSIDILLSNLVPIDDVVNKISNKELGEKVKNIYELYQYELISNNYVDYNTLLFFTYKLLNEKPIIKKQLQIVYKYICVDEFQDTNFAQYSILKELINPNTKNIFVVADDDQIIYQWNGADPKRLFELINDYSMKVIQLPENYRCPPSIVKLANSLIAHNEIRSESKNDLVANKKEELEDVIKIFNFSDEQDEYDWIASDLLNNHHDNLKDCAILARNKRLLDNLSVKLKDKKITPYLAVKKNDFESSPLVWLYNILKLSNSRNEKTYLNKICKSFYELEGVNLNLDDIYQEAQLYNNDLLRAFIELCMKQTNIEKYTLEYLNTIKRSIVNNLNVLLFINQTLTWCDGLNENDQHPNPEFFTDYKEEKNIWVELQNNIINQYGKDNISLHLMLQEIDLAPKIPQEQPNSIKCYTIHNSKGLEFNHVYLIGLVEDNLPSFQSIKKNNKVEGDCLEMQEERRNCFVAITRAQQSLTLTYSNKYNGWSKSPSRFLYEMNLLKKD